MVIVVVLLTSSNHILGYRGGSPTAVQA